MALCLAKISGYGAVYVSAFGKLEFLSTYGLEWVACIFEKTSTNGHRQNNSDNPVSIEYGVRTWTKKIGINTHQSSTVVFQYSKQYKQVNRYKIKYKSTPNTMEKGQ